MTSWREDHPTQQFYGPTPTADITERWLRHQGIRTAADETMQAMLVPIEPRRAPRVIEVNAMTRGEEIMVLAFMAVSLASAGALVYVLARAAWNLAGWAGLR